VAPIQPKVGVFVFPIMIPPAAFKRSTMGASSVGTLSRKSGVPNVVRTFRVVTRSFTLKGMPCSGPSLAPRLPSARSAAFASRRAWSALMSTYALSRGLSLSMRVRTESTSSTGDTFFLRMRAASSVTDSHQRS
jgi:hypothetical protein